MSSRSVSYAINRFVLRRKKLLATAPRYRIKLKVVTEDVVGRHIYKYGAHEPEITDMLLRELRLGENDIALDVGANIGWYSLILGAIAAKGGASVFAFEPDPVNFALLSENLQLNSAGNVHAVQKGIADSAGTLELHLFSDRNRGRHSLLPIHEGQTVEIATVALDEFWHEKAGESATPAFLKMDIEGFELVALRGASKVLAACPFVMLEFSPQFMKAGGLKPAELIELMHGQGFTAYGLSSGQLVPIDTAELLSRDQQVDLFWRRL